jgi:two-component system chemotaxis response regulator CheY
MGLAFYWHNRQLFLYDGLSSFSGKFMLKAIILDNQAVARDLLASVLANGGHEVVGGSNTNLSNLARLIKLQPQIVCVDIGEANPEGLRIIETLRKEFPRSLLFLVSAQLDADIIQAAQERGVSGFIVKPFNAGAVLSAIRNTVIRIAQQQKQKNDPAETEPSPDQ